jgi:hypothetical protein
MSANTRQPERWLPALRVYAGVSALGHLAWETLHLPLYTLWTTGTSGEKVFAVVHCTAGDIMIATLSLLAALAMLGTSRWPAERAGVVFAAALIFGLGYTAFSEWLNTMVRASWAYSATMPTLPVLGTGLSPLLQWIVVPSTAMWFALRWRVERHL